MSKKETLQAPRLDHPLSQYIDERWGDDRSGALGLCKHLIPITRAVAISDFGTEGERLEMIDHIMCVRDSLEAYAIQEGSIT